ncbi:hypothetical protein KPL71_026663 [Citrus sinensis]|uniref:Uncharacterized protein n=1 Tax=Citrus sinensis TaxID=2711 RepID=A0ACB8I158_CITSI|nr:hypothetical protein KPL71_026663 [Citrus sinensis]
MSTSNAINLSSMPQNFKPLSLSTLCKSIAISGLILFLFYSFPYSHPYKRSTNLFMPFIERKETDSSNNHTPNSPTILSYMVFVLLEKNITRGHLWLDAAPTGELVPWPSSCPPFRVNEDITRLNVYLISVAQNRMYHSILKAFRVENNKDVKWYVMADDDTLIFVDNLVELLGKYDHTKYYYIAGYALSYALVEALASEIDGCIQSYKHLFFSDYISHSRSADLGVDLKTEKGIHSIFPRSFLRRPLETFRPWQKSRPPFFMFNTRWLSNNPFEAPRVFFLESVIESNSIGRYQVVITNYTRSSPSNLPICLSNAGRIECCDVKFVAGEDTVDVKLRACMKGEMLA